MTEKQKSHFEKIHYPTVILEPFSIGASESHLEFHFLIIEAILSQASVAQ